MRIEGVIDKGWSMTSEPSPIIRKRHARTEVFLTAFASMILGITCLSAIVFSQELSNENGPIIRMAGYYAPEVYPQPEIIGDAGATTSVWVLVFDGDGDVLHVEFEWGDGTPNGTYDSAPGYEEITVYHIWSPPPIQGVGGYDVPYTLNITASDPDGRTTTESVPVSIFVGFNGCPQQNVTAPLYADPADVVLIEAYATDPEGESLTWTFVFNDSSSDFLFLVYNTGWTSPGETVWNNITHVFGAEGNFSVTLYVSDALPPNQVFPHNVSMKVYVKVQNNQAPIFTQIDCNPASPMIPEFQGYVDVELTVELMDRDGEVVTGLWDFGDGSSGKTNMSTGGTGLFTFVQMHRYTAIGQYNVSIEFSDGRQDHNRSEFLIVTVTPANMPPEVILFSLGAYGPPNKPPIDFVGEAVPFRAVISDSEHDSIELVWDFGDGEPHVYDNVTQYVDGNATSWVNHTFVNPGNYTIMIWYTDGESGYGDHSKEYSFYYVEVRVDYTPPTADAGPNQTVVAPTTVSFNGTGSHDEWGSVNLTWTFIHDGIPVTLWGPTPTFEFTQAGIYIVVLNVTDHVGNYNTTTVTIEVADIIPEFTSLLPIGAAMTAIFACLTRRRSRSA